MKVSICRQFLGSKQYSHNLFRCYCVKGSWAKKALILSVHAVRPDRNEVKVRIHVQECHCGPICNCKFIHLGLKGQKLWKCEQLISLMLHLQKSQFPHIKSKVTALSGQCTLGQYFEHALAMCLLPVFRRFTQLLRESECREGRSVSLRQDSN